MLKYRILTTRIDYARKTTSSSLSDERYTSYEAAQKVVDEHKLCDRAFYPTYPTDAIPWSYAIIPTFD